jgi:hypothetical protein
MENAWPCRGDEIKKPCQKVTGCVINNQDLFFTCDRFSANDDEEWEMPKENIRKMNAVLASVFAHTGHISKEEAKQISGLDDHHFEQAYEKASRVADKVMSHEGNKMDKLIEHFAKEIEDYSTFFLL